MPAAVDTRSLAFVYLFCQHVNPAAETIEHQRRLIDFCASLDQFHRFEDEAGCYGFVAWLRCDPFHLPIFRCPDWTAHEYQQLSRDELTTGAILYVAECLALRPRLAYNAVMGLSRLPGVQWMAAWHKGSFRLRRVRKLR